MNDFFQFAVIGPVPAGRMGLASGCRDCRESQQDAPRCEGFGAGCLGLRAAPPAEQNRK